MGTKSKLKTNKTYAKKFRVRKSGSVKRAQAFTSHNSGKRRSKRTRRLRKIVQVSKADVGKIKREMPYLRIGQN
ncbi:MAG: 50S ribosomal protein L35 [Candidatus Dadabacteria bacterium]|nr:MAG: 50S ribosomal protein L35 [Candidatus Dadabacteria bacterium]